MKNISYAKLKYRLEKIKWEKKMKEYEEKRNQENNK